MKQRWQQGLADAQTTLRASPWLAPMPSNLGVRVFDVIHDVLTRNDAVVVRSHAKAMTVE
jgi:NTE family protein